MFLDENGDPSVGKILSTVFAGVISIVLFFSSFEIINAGEVGVRLRLGAIKGEPITEGLYFKVPFTDVIETMSVRTQKTEVETGAASKDLQDVKVKVAVNYQLDATKADGIWREFQNKYEESIVVPAVLESIKAASAQYTAEELITKRAEVREKMVTNIGDKLQPRGIFVREVNITNFDFSPSFNTAIEAKVTAEQNALASKNKLEQVKYEAQQKIESAKGEAESIRIQSQALSEQPQFLDKVAIEKWNGVLPQYMAPGAALPFIQVR